MGMVVVWGDPYLSFLSTESKLFDKNDRSFQPISLRAPIICTFNLLLKLARFSPFGFLTNVSTEEGKNNFKRPRDQNWVSKPSIDRGGGEKCVESSRSEDARNAIFDHARSIRDDHHSCSTTVFHGSTSMFHARWRRGNSQSGLTNDSSSYPANCILSHLFSSNDFSHRSKRRVLARISRIIRASLAVLQAWMDRVYDFDESSVIFPHPLQLLFFPGLFPSMHERWNWAHKSRNRFYLYSIGR